jgi:hypothetical protein
MNYREKERQRAVEIRDSLFRDPGSGVFAGKEREFVLSEPSLNLWEGIREDCKHYFNENKIVWWKGKDGDPTGHLLSSQVACLNHLYYARQRSDVANAILKRVDSSIVQAVKMEDAFVHFEYIGKRQYLNEKDFRRGANCTSIDAAMVGERADKTRVLFFIEWKYTEIYPQKDCYITERSKVYDDLIQSDDSPFNPINVQAFYFEPFYQMMRQTLLAQACVKAQEYDCTDFLHVHVIPSENMELLNTITSPYLSGKSISDAWKVVLKSPQKYLSLSPDELLSNCVSVPDTRSWLSYIRKRYW